MTVEINHQLFPINLLRVAASKTSPTQICAAVHQELLLCWICCFSIFSFLSLNKYELSNLPAKTSLKMPSVKMVQKLKFPFYRRCLRQAKALKTVIRETYVAAVITEVKVEIGQT